MIVTSLCKFAVDLYKKRIKNCCYLRICGLVLISCDILVKKKYNIFLPLMKCLTLERPSASIDAFEVFNFLYLHRILIFFPKTFGHFLYYCNVEFVCFLRVLRTKQQV